LGESERDDQSISFDNGERFKLGLVNKNDTFESYVKEAIKSPQE